MRELFSLYGPLGIQAFGLFIVLGIILFTILFLRDPRVKKLMSDELYYNGLSGSIIVGFIGGRLLYLSTNAHTSFWHIFAFWQGGFSLLGGVIALAAFIPWYLKKNRVPIVASIDVISTYAPLLQSISRIGCFFAGCCFGQVTQVPWAIRCNHELIHPTQLYSAAFLFLIFLFLYLFGQRLFARTGYISCVYLILMSVERFLIDFWRGDREFNLLSSYLSVSQQIALVLTALGMVGFVCFTVIKVARKS